MTAYGGHWLVESPLMIFAILEIYLMSPYTCEIVPKPHLLQFYTLMCIIVKLSQLLLFYFTGLVIVVINKICVEVPCKYNAT